MNAFLLLILMLIAKSAFADSVTFIINNQVSSLRIEDRAISLGMFADQLGRHRDTRLDWFRASRISEQEDELSACGHLVESMTATGLRPADWVKANHEDFRKKLLDLLDSLAATGRVTEFGRLDAIRLKTEGIVDRRLRDGDRIQVINQDVNEVFVWNVRDGFLAKPHAPNKMAYAYIGDAFREGVIRGDYVYAISPGGTIRLIGVATHNESNEVIAPGTLLFMPPPGFGRSEQKAFRCVAQVLSYQDINEFERRRAWRD